MDSRSEHAEPGGQGVDAYWDGVGRHWIRHQPDWLWREHTDRLQFAWIRRWLGLSKGSSVLKTDLFDEVAGVGIVARLATLGCRISGVDLSPAIVAEASRRNPGLDAIAADIRALPFAEASFDAVFSGSTLDHFDQREDIHRALVEIARVLRPGGTLVLTLDNPCNPIVRIRNGPILGWLRRVGIVPYQVGVTLEHRSLVALLEVTGFAVNQMTSAMHCPRALAVPIARLLARANVSTRERFLRHLMAWESLEKWPSRFRTGHFTAVQAIRNRP